MLKKKSKPKPRSNLKWKESLKLSSLCFEYFWISQTRQSLIFALLIALDNMSWDIETVYHLLQKVIHT